MRTPADYPHRILLAVTGLSPQVVTETLYALATQQPAFIPTEIHLITTTSGAERARLALLSESSAWFHRLREDYRLPPIDFGPDHIHVLTDATGQALADIRHPADNEAAADFICDHLRRLTAQRDSALHVSIAGGRKTMGYYLGYALSLYARPQDRLSHVLVNEPFESSWDFFYPTPYSQVITTRDGSLADTRDAKVNLAEIPFVSLRHGLDEKLLNGKSRFSEVVASARQNLAPASLHIDLTCQRVRAAGKTFRLPPVQLALLTLFARRAKNRQAPLAAPPKSIPDKHWAERLLTEYQHIRGNAMDSLERTAHALRHGMDGDYFSSQKSALHKNLRRQLGSLAGDYLIDDGGSRPRRYSLKLPPEAIQISEPRASSTHQETSP